MNKSAQCPLLISEISFEDFDDKKVLDRLSTYVFIFSVDRSYDKIKHQYLSVLSDQECEKSCRFSRNLDRKRYIVRKYFLRSILSKLISAEPHNISFHLIGNKKPSLDGIEFNVSHSEDFVAIALGPKTIGIDIERINPEFNFTNMLSNCFSKPEIDFILDGDYLSNFYVLWTRKEAIVKATGEGLTEELPLINCLSDTMDRNQRSFKLSTYKIQKDYILSLALHIHPENKIFFTIH